MIKIYDIWEGSFSEFVEDVAINIDNVSIVILDFLNEVEYLFDESTFVKLLDATSIKNIPVKLLTPNTKPLKLKHTYQNIEIIVWQAFWFFRTLQAWTYPNNKSLNKSKNIDMMDMAVCKNFNLEHPYICLNNIIKYHRCVFMDALAKHNLMQHGKVSWRNLNRSPEEFKFNWQHWNPDRLLLDQDGREMFLQETMPLEFNNSFMQLVTESDDAITFFSEKTATPLLLNKPFLVFANQGFHSDLKQLGFEPYDELFDYSFDSEPDIFKRAEMLIQTIKPYIGLSSSELNAKYASVWHKITRNKKLALNYAMQIPPEVRNLSKLLKEKNIDYHGPLNKIKWHKEHTMKKVAMIGVGKLGQDCAEVMASHYDVVGYDIEPRNPAFPMKDTIAEAVKDRDFIFIAAPTPHDPIYGGETPTSHLPNKDFDYTIVKNILEEVNKHVNKNQLVVLISTVLPGTVRNLLEPCITNARFIYNPYLIAMGTIKWDMVNPEMVIIGTQDGSLTGDAKELIDFYKVFMENNPRYEVGTWDEAEAIKIFYNTFISTKLALVNMIQDVAETNGNMNVDVVTNALAKSTYRIMGPMYMKAALGDAGACHPRDNIALRYLADRLNLGYDLFDAIMSAREKQAERMALACLKHGKNVTIVGKAYKPKVPYTHGSASMLVGHYIEKHGGNLNYYDENTGDLDLRSDWTEVYLIGYWEEYVSKLNFKNAIVIDPWRQFVSSEHQGQIIHYGSTRGRY